MSTPACTHPMTAVSLFDGIGGFPEAFRRSGIRTVATCEIDKAAAGVSADHFPEAKAFPDVTELTADELIAAGFCPACGVVSAGWPCTDLSLAGLRLGLGGARSGLIGPTLQLIGSLRPRWVLLENVPGLLSSVCPCPGSGVCTAADCTAAHVVRGGACGRRLRRGRATGAGRCMALHGGGMGTVLGQLVELGYGVAYRVLDAQHFGVPQRRRRVVIVGCLGDWAAPAQVLLEPEGGSGDPGPGGPAGAGAARGADGVVAGGRREVVSTIGLSGIGGNGGPDDNAAQAGHLVGVDLAQITSAENRVNPQPGDPQPPLAATGRPAVAYRGHGSNVGPMGTLRASSGSVASGVPFLAQTLTARQGKGPDSDGGNVVATVSVTGQRMCALTSEGADASEDGTGRGTPIIGFNEAAGGNSIHEGVSPSIKAGTGGAATTLGAHSMVRRLTPVECERLQGYPDGWTATSYGRPQSDSARYRELGNSIAVPVFVWVAGRIARHTGGAA